MITWSRTSMQPSAAKRSLDHREERLAFFDDVRRELCGAAGADVPRRVDRAGRDEQDVAGREGHRRLVLHRVFPRAFEDIDDLFARMRVPRGRRSRREFDDRLDDLTSRDAEIMPLEI